jgi:ABC-type arginine transport system ATPase subunit
VAYLDRETQRAYQRQWIANRRAAALEGKRCAFCDSEGPLEFHHFDPAIKVHHAVWSWSQERRDAELAKCIVICHDCHVARHRADRPVYCKRGHELTRANSYVKPRTKRRECRTCRAMRRHRQDPFPDSVVPERDAGQRAPGAAA